MELCGDILAVCWVCGFDPVIWYIKLCTDSILAYIPIPVIQYEPLYCFVFAGSILEGPEPDNLKPLVEKAMPTLIELLKDQSVVVRDTAAWCVGRVCELLSDAVLNEIYLKPLLGSLVEGLGMEPRVAANVCWVS